MGEWEWEGFGAGDRESDDEGEGTDIDFFSPGHANANPSPTAGCAANPKSAVSNPAPAFITFAQPDAVSDKILQLSGSLLGTGNPNPNPNRNPNRNRNRNPSGASYTPPPAPPHEYAHMYPLEVALSNFSIGSKLKADKYSPKSPKSKGGAANGEEEGKKERKKYQKPVKPAPPGCVTMTVHVNAAETAYHPSSSVRQRTTDR